MIVCLGDGSVGKELATPAWGGPELRFPEPQRHQESLADPCNPSALEGEAGIPRAALETS